MNVLPTACLYVNVQKYGRHNELPDVIFASEEDAHEAQRDGQITITLEKLFEEAKYKSEDY